jgi:SAM-dependent methyltransferase
MFIDQSAAWITSLLPKVGKILDLGCGPGLYSKRVAKQGFQVTGMDISDCSLSYAREHDLQSTYFSQSYLTLDFENEFDAVTLICCDYGALTEVERLTLLQKAFHALKPGGLFLFDVFTPVCFNSKAELTSWNISAQGRFWSVILIFAWKPPIATERGLN